MGFLLRGFLCFTLDALYIFFDGFFVLPFVQALTFLQGAD